MTYRELQIILKAWREDGTIPQSFKLNQKKVILQAKYDEVRNASADRGLSEESLEAGVIPAMAVESEPSNPRLIGIEFEFLSVLHRDTINEKLTEAGINVIDKYRLNRMNENAQRRYKDYWIMQTDTSVREGNLYGYEVCTPPMPMLAPETWRQIRVVLQVLRDNHCKVNRTCGTHVHFDVAGWTGTQALQLLESWEADEETVFDPLLSKSRQANKNRFALSVIGLADRLRAAENRLSIFNGGASCPLSDMRHLQAAYHVANNCAGRYYKVNLMAYNKHQTIEIRAHQGTLNTKKIKDWVMLNAPYFNAVDGRN